MHRVRGPLLQRRGLATFLSTQATDLCLCERRLRGGQRLPVDAVLRRRVRARTLRGYLSIADELRSSTNPRPARGQRRATWQRAALPSLRRCRRAAPPSRVRAIFGHRRAVPPAETLGREQGSSLWGGTKLGLRTKVVDAGLPAARRAALACSRANTGTGPLRNWTAVAGESGRARGISRRAGA